MLYPKGRLVEGYTASSRSGTKVTDEGFSYTARGELKNFYESTPNSGGYYSVPITYWANGLVETFGPFLTYGSLGYNPDGEGRPYSLQSTDYLHSTTYNAASQPTQLMTPCTSGTNCYPISYQYDPNTLRMTQYSWALSGGTVSGSLTWNPNGSLQQLVVADPFNSADVQTCNYSADDLTRISSVSCNSGSVWGQQFTYDAFGNLTKSVPTGATGITWQPGYSSSTNRYTLGGTSYDANGNLLKDTFNIYTWDAEGKNLSIAYDNGGGVTSTFTDDAFGHKVEWSLNGTYQASYVTLGNYKLSATGQTANYSLYPLPGGSFLSFGGGLQGVQMADWLGTIRAVASDSGTDIQTGAHAPFGEEYAFTAKYPKPSVFTGQEDDGSDNPTMYYFQERNYPSSQGRWLSPDPAGLGAVNPTNPQSWNRYAYALNNPLSYIDPTGLFCVWDDGSYDSADDPGTGTASSCGSAGGNWFDGNPSDWGLNADWSSQANANFAAQWLNQQPDYTFQTQAWAAMPSDFSFTFGVLAPGQTFTQCMGANVNNYSMGGSLELGANVAFGFNSSVSSNPVVSTFTGNGVAGLMFGGGSDAAQTGLTSAPDLVRAGMGTVTTFGRNSTNIMALNIARVGGTPQALSSASSGAGSFLESASSFFSMGMKAGTRWAIDFALTGAEAIGCWIPRGY